MRGSEEGSNFGGGGRLQCSLGGCEEGESVVDIFEVIEGLMGELEGLKFELEGEECPLQTVAFSSSSIEFKNAISASN